MFENVLIDKIIIGKEKSSNCLHIAFAISNNYTRPIGITISSIMSMVDTMNYVFHIIIDGRIDKSELDRFRDLSEKFNIEICIYYFDNEIFKGLDDREFTLAAYYRFAIPYLLKSRTNRFLYLDADVLIIKNLSGVKKLSLGDKVAGVVKEFTIKSDDGSKYEYNSDYYFNSGMMYVNIPKWIEEQVSEKCMAILREINADESKKTKYGYVFQCYDQDALNIVLKGKVKFLEPKYNFLTNISLKNNKNLTKVPDDTVIIHYHGFNKPWHEWCFHPLNKYYRQVAKDSPWADVPWDNKPTKYRQMRLYSKYYLKKGNLVNSIHWLWKSIKKKNER